MLYRLVRPLAAIGIRANYQHICLSNTDRIPTDKPVILAANHPTAFMEPCILACFLDRPLFFLVRGDFFARPIFDFLLRQLHMLPVFRMRDGGYTKLKNNYSTFAACSQALYANKTIMILAEGGTHHEKRLRPIQKGTARIALGTLDSFPDIEDVYIVPVGVNYTYAERSRTRVMINFGEAISTRSYLKEYQESSSVAIHQITNDLAAALRKHIVIIERKEDEQLAEYLLRLQRPLIPLPIFPVINEEIHPLEQEIAMVNRVNIAEASTKTSWLNELADYFRQLDEKRIKETNVLGKDHSGYMSLLLLVLGFIPFLLGYFWNAIPLGIAKYIADTKVKDIAFYTPVKWATGIGSYLIWTIFWMALILIQKYYIGLLLVFAFSLLGYFSVYYGEFLQKYLSSTRWAALEDSVKHAFKAKADRLLSGRLD